jgi:hypothetical protein
MRTLLRLAVAVLRAAADSLDSESPPSSASTRPTPTTSTPAPTDALVERMMTTMGTTVTKMMEETRELVVTLAQGRPEPQMSLPSGPAATPPLTFLEPNYTDDSIPLPPGIEAALWRESTEEAEQERLLRANADLQRQRDELLSRLVPMDQQGPQA